MATKTNPKVKTKEEKDKDKAILAGFILGGSILGMLLLRRSAGGEEPPNGNGNGVEPGEYTDLFGHVANIQTKLPIEGVTVEVVGFGSTLTNEDGQYMLLGIPNGTYTVRFSHPEYETVEL